MRVKNGSVSNSKAVNKGTLIEVSHSHAPQGKSGRNGEG